LELVDALLTGDPRARGRVLDAGTGGGHMTALLAARRPVELVSVSLDDSSFARAGERLPAGAVDRVVFILGDLADPGFLAGRTFDLVVGDYLLAAVAGHRPFREDQVLRSLVSRLARDGLLVLTGMEPFEPRRSREGEVVWAILRWRDALAILGGDEPYREVPGWWAAERLREAGMKAREPLHSEPLRWSPAGLRAVADSGLRAAGRAGDPRVLSTARARLGALCREAEGLARSGGKDGRLAWGRDWVVLAGPSASGPARGEPGGPGAERTSQQPSGPRQRGSTLVEYHTV